MFVSCCPYYISLGMTYDEYWYGEPERATMYRKASYISKQNGSYDAWLNGLYNFDAFANVIANAFAKKGSKQNKYMDHPIDVLPKSDDERLEEAMKQRKLIEKQLTAWANSFSKR